MEEQIVRYLRDASPWVVGFIALIFVARSLPRIIEAMTNYLRELHTARNEPTEVMTDAVKIMREVTQDLLASKQEMVIELRAYKETVEARDSRIYALQTQVDKLQSLYEKAKTEAASATRRVNELEEALTGRDRKVVELENALAAEKEARQSAETERDEKREQHDKEWQKKVEDLNHEVETLRKQLESQNGKEKPDDPKVESTKPAAAGSAAG